MPVLLAMKDERKKVSLAEDSICRHGGVHDPRGVSASREDCGLNHLGIIWQERTKTALAGTLHRGSDGLPSKIGQEDYSRSR